MNLVRPSPLLKTALLADALGSAAAALLQLAFAAPLAALVRLPEALLFDSGLFMLAYVALLAFMVRSTRLAEPLVWLLVAGNVGWALGCVAAAWWLAPDAIGLGYIVMHALAPLTFAALEYRGLVVSPAADARPAAMAG